MANNFVIDVYCRCLQILYQRGWLRKFSRTTLMSASLTKFRSKKLMNTIESSICALYFFLLRNFYMLYFCFVILNFPCIYFVREADGSRFLLKFPSDYSQKSSWLQLMIQFVACVYINKVDKEPMLFLAQ